MIGQKAFGFLLLALVASIAQAAVKVPVTVYYESLCPDSAKLITEQIHPAVKGELRDYVDIKWVPFGKSSYSTQGSEVNFNCHHGPNECYGNKVHACALEHIQANSYQTEFTRESLVLDFITCLMRAGKNFDDNVYPGERCAREARINSWEMIQSCANSTEGSQLLKKYGDDTNMFENPLTSVPVVVYRDQKDAKVSEMAQRNFLGTTCKYITAPQPRICAAHGDATSNKATAALAIFGVVAYAVMQLF